MPRGILTPAAVAAEVVRAFGLTGSIRRAALAAGVSFPAARRILREAKLAAPARLVADEVRKEGEAEGAVEFTTAKRITTLAEAIAHASVDLTVWRVKDWECTGWQSGMKLRQFDREAKGKIVGEAPHVEPLWRIKLRLERIMPRDERAALDGLFARLAAGAPKFATAPPSAHAGEPHLMVLDLVDTHFGKLAWAPETGQNYDLKIADRVYRDAVADLLERAGGLNVEEFLIPLGSDFLHVDNANGSTTAGTPQDVDGRLAKILETAEAAVVWAVDLLAARGNVVLRWVPGNHDRTLSYCLARTIKAYFRHNGNVTVDVSSPGRKYHRYHGTLLGLTHGDCERHASLPAIMATERPHEWAGTQCREWHIGHLHKSKRLDFLGLDTHNGVPVRTLRSLSAVDAWHHRQGYVGTTRSAEAYLYTRTGYAGHFVADVRAENTGGVLSS